MPRKPADPLAKPTKLPRARTGKTSVRVLDMKREAWRLRLAGYSIPEIGDQLGVTRQRAWQLLDAENKAVQDETHQAAADYRALQVARHESRLRELQTIIASAKSLPSERIAAFGQIRGIEAELSKLMGAYAPAKAEVSGPDGSPIGVFAVPLAQPTTEAWVAKAAELAAGEEAKAAELLGIGGGDEATPTS